MRVVARRVVALEEEEGVTEVSKGDDDRLFGLLFAFVFVFVCGLPMVAFVAEVVLTLTCDESSLAANWYP